MSNSLLPSSASVPSSDASSKEDTRSFFEPIAIVGIGGLFPGSLDVGAFWQNILEGADLISDVPDSHWKVSDYYDADLKAPDKTYGKRGGFLPDVPFDTLSFGVPPNLLPSTDTSQLLGLMVARTTLEDAIRGSLDDADKSRIACILGVTSGQELFGQLASRLRQPEWAAGMRAAGIDEETIAEAVEKIGETMVPWTEASFPGLLGNVVAGRIANRLDLGGMNAVTDAACASSFAAISMAIDELLLRRSDIVLSGGVDALNDIFMHMCFSKTPALSKSGDVRPFDANADGTLLGEGLGMVALRRLEDAERDGNKIYAVIRGVGSSSDGKSKSVYAPVSAGQASALTRSYDMAGYSASTVELVECHGTGTVAGDVAELGGLKLAFADAAEERKGDTNWCAVGSVKAQIGHTKSSAGVAGLLKVALALHDKVLPPTIKVDTPNPKADWQTSPFYVNSETRPWIRGPSHPRRGSVSSFGFGGSNFHITLEEYVASDATTEHIGRLRPRAGLLTVDGADRNAVAAKLRALATEATDIASSTPKGVATDRFAFERLCAKSHKALTGAAARAAITATDLTEFAKRATQAADGIARGDDKLVPGATFGEGDAPGALAVLFPGQGSQSVNMGRDLALSFHAARATFDEADTLSFDGENLSRVVFPAPAFSDVDKKAQAAKITRTEWAQPALGVAGVATWRVLRSLGVDASMFAGHSYGELVALHAAGAMTFEDLLRLSRKRGELMAAASERPGAMAAVLTSPDKLAPFLADASGVVIANENAPEQTVVSGERDAVDALVAKLADAGIRARKLPVSTAFHSPLVEDACGPMGTFLESLSFSPLKATVFANESAAPYPADSAGQKALLSAQIGRRVRFVDEIRAMYDAGARVFLEVGPATVLTGLAGRIVGDDAVCIATDAKGREGSEALLAAIGRLFTLGFGLNFAALSSDLPPAPRERPAPKMAVMIGGANVGKPTPPAPKPPRARAPVVTTPSLPAVPPTAVSMNGTSPVAARAPASPAPSAPLSAPVGSGVSMSNAPRSLAPGWLDVIREGQRQTAEAHSTFQRALSDAHVAFLEAYEQTTSTLTGAALGQAPSAAPPAVAAPAFAAPVAPVIAAPVIAAPVIAAALVVATPSVDTTALMLEVVGEKTGYPVDALDLTMALEADLGVDSIKRVEILGALRERIPSLPDLDAVQAAQLVTLQDVADSIGPVAGASANGNAPAAAVSNVDTTALMLEVVGEKTGYPVDALDLTMALEADLGVDSIKRVEILGALRERIPSLPDLDAVQAAQLVTLQDVADSIGPVAGAKASAVAAATGPTVDATAVMLEVVAEKTGYPVDALDLSMALEADLGVDSIKRVEILGALRERIPSLPDLDAVQAAQLVTLQDVANSVGAGAAPAQAPVPAASSVDATAVMLEVVAEKTGYPVDALDLSMALEADLGVDSIKRVEILGALRDRVPSLPDLDAVQAAQLVTLADIVSSLGGDAAAPAVETASAIDITAVMLEVVAEKTGYPVDALDLSMALEADLGVDSIKRVEILGALRDRVPSLPDLDAVQAAQLVTLADVAASMGPTPAPEVASADVASNGTVNGTGSFGAPSNGTASQTLIPVGAALEVGDDFAMRTTTRRAVALERRLAVSGTEPRLRQGLVAILDDGTGVAGALVAAMADRGMRANVIPADLRDVDAATYRGLVLLGFDPAADGHTLARTTLAAVQKFAPVLREGGALIAAFDLEGTLGIGLKDRARASTGALAGLVKTAALEWEDVSARVIDVDGGMRSAADVAKALADEFDTGFSEIEVALSDARRVPVLIDVEARDPVPAIAPGDLVVATGGARGVTAVCLQRLAELARPSLLLLGRTPLVEERATTADCADEAALRAALIRTATARQEKPNPVEIRKEAARILATREVRATIARLESVGAKVAYTAVDVRDPAALSAALDDARAAFGPVRGIVHGAGVLADKRIEDKNAEQLSRVWGTKVDGFTALLDATANDDLRFICAFSSVAGRFGNAGQVDYSMANEAISKRSQAEASVRGPGCVVKAIAWGPWDGGMVTPALKAHFESQGISVLPLDEGAQHFVEAMSSPGAVEVVVGGPIAAEMRVQHHVSRKSYAFLADHAVQGTPVLPAVLALEFVTGAAKRRRPDLAVVSVDDVRVRRGVRLEHFENGGDLLEVVLGPEEIHGDKLQMTARVQPHGGGSPHYTATVVMALSRPDVKVSPAARSGALFAAKNTIYEDMLFHGPAFQLLGDVDADNEQMFANVTGLGGASWGEDGSWHVDAAALDAGLQLALLQARRSVGGAFLPTALGRYVAYAPDLGKRALLCVATLKESSRDKVVVNLSFVDEGQVIFELEGVEAHRVPGDAGYAPARAS